MSRFITLVLLSLVFVLTCFMGIVLVTHLFAYRFPSLPPAQPSTSTIEYRTEESTRRLPSSWFLSKLQLLPGWQKDRRLVAVIIENHEVARPNHVGLKEALMIQEFLVEGEISRFAVIYDMSNLPKQIGPVRSLRPYFIDGLLPEVRAIFHAGGSPEALERAEEDDAVVAFNGLYYPDHFLRDEDLPAPHNLFLTRSTLLDLLEEHPDKVLWPSYEIGVSDSETKAVNVRINFFNPLHNVLYTYNALSGTYARTNGSEVSGARPSNLLMLEMPIMEVGEFGRLTINVEGKGRALLFRSGLIQEGFWKKDGSEDSFVFENEQGDPMEFARGQTWMTVVPTLERVRWE